jgi:MoaA/NifB/PqqE/SkfB family radical SAM enzyme
MNAYRLVKIAMNHVPAALSEALYLNTGIDLTYPTFISGIVNERCNYKCLQCACWRLERYEEMTIAQWQVALASLKEFLGPFTIQFSGGEPFLKKGFLDLLESCREQSIEFGVITNGSAFANPGLVSRLVASRPLKVDISVDGPTAEIHDRLRRVPGSLDAITRGIAALRAEQGRTGLRFPVRIKPTLNASNFRSMPALVSWAVDAGATSIDIQPICSWTEESRGELWLEPADIPDLETVVAELIRLKADGKPIETSEHQLRNLPAHFLHQAPIPLMSTCLIGLRKFTIDPRGVVTTCGEFAPIGDVTKESAKDIWQGYAARENRRQTTACTKGCTFGCLPKSLSEKLRRGLMLLQRG